LQIGIGNKINPIATKHSVQQRKWYDCSRISKEIYQILTMFILENSFWSRPYTYIAIEKKLVLLLQERYKVAY
jgi:hypothetical protein